MTFSVYPEYPTFITSLEPESIVSVGDKVKFTSTGHWIREIEGKEGTVIGVDLPTVEIFIPSWRDSPGRFFINDFAQGRIHIIKKYNPESRRWKQEL